MNYSLGDTVAYSTPSGKLHMGIVVGTWGEGNHSGFTIVSHTPTGLMEMFKGYDDEILGVEKHAARW